VCQLIQIHTFTDAFRSVYRISSPVGALTELYQHYVRPFGQRMEQLLTDRYSIAILDITEQMTKPNVVRVALEIYVHS
jgi:hypothetical protein